LFYLNNKIKNKKYHTVRTIPNSNRKIVERSKFDTPNSKMHYHSLSWLDTGTSINRDGVKLALWVQISNN
jgi:hypothetical protein